MDNIKIAENHYLDKQCQKINEVMLRKHMISVADTAYELYRELFSDNKEAVKIYKAGLHHDVGKLLWHDELFIKNFKFLTDTDKLDILRHPEDSLKYLKYKMPYWAYKDYTKDDISVIDLIFLHHEKPNGRGYYRVSSLPIESMLLSISDIFSACTEFRFYRDPMPVHIAINIALQDYQDKFSDEQIEIIKCFLD